MSETRSTVNSGQVVAEFGAAFAKKDFVSARRWLHDDLTFRGPIDTFHRADDYIASIKNLAAIMKGIKEERTIAEGQEIAVFYILDTQIAAAPVADWYTVRDGKIASIRTYFDARPFAPPAGRPGH